MKDVSANMEETPASAGKTLPRGMKSPRSRMPVKKARTANTAARTDRLAARASLDAAKQSGSGVKKARIQMKKARVRNQSTRTRLQGMIAKNKPRTGGPDISSPDNEKRRAGIRERMNIKSARGTAMIAKKRQMMANKMNKVSKTYGSGGRSAALIRKKMKMNNV